MTRDDVRIKSKYQRKTLEVVEYNLEEFSCLVCGKPCMVDTSKGQIEWDDDDVGDRIIVYCPYCGMKHRILC